MNQFMALGGGNEFGGSSYYLSLDGVNILLDCGARTGRALRTSPPYPDYEVLTNEVLDGLFELDLVFITHSHYDHIGSLPYIAKQATEAPIFATATTKKFTELQLRTLKRGLNEKYNSEKINELKEAEIDLAIDKMNDISYSKTYKYKNINYTLYEAGHISGAAMIYFQSKDLNVLYTGDFSDQAYPLTPSYNLPKNLKVDVLIMCASKAFKKNYFDNMDFDELINRTNQLINQKNNVMIKLYHLTKGIELVQILNNLIESGDLPEVTIYLNHKLGKIADTYEDAGFSIFSKYVRRFSNNLYNKQKKPFIFITDDDSAPEVVRLKHNTNFETIGKGLSLHCSYEGLKSLVFKYRPKRVLLVHTERRRGGNIIEDLNELAKDQFSIEVAQNITLYHL